MKNENRYLIHKENGVNFIPPSVKIPNPLFEFLSRPLQSFEYKMSPTGSRGWMVASQAGGIILRNSGNCRRQALGPWGHTLGMSCVRPFLLPLPFFSVTKKKRSSSSTDFCHSDLCPRARGQATIGCTPETVAPKKHFFKLQYSSVLVTGSYFQKH